MKRPWYLTVLLVFGFLGAIWQIFTANSSAGLLPNLPSWYPMVLIILAVVDLVAVVMIWMWKIMGFYLTVGTSAVQLLIVFIYMGVAVGIGAIILNIIMLGLLFLAMRPVWKNFK